MGFTLKTRTKQEKNKNEVTKQKNLSEKINIYFIKYFIQFISFDPFNKSSLIFQLKKENPQKKQTRYFFVSKNATTDSFFKQLLIKSNFTFSENLFIYNYEVYTMLSLLDSKDCVCFICWFCSQHNTVQIDIRVL